MLDVMRMIVLVACVGCWSARDEGPPATTTPIANTVAPVTRPARPRRTEWLGQYVCTQGVTALKLTLERDADRIDGTFEFGPHDSNPGVPHGAYRLTGVATRDGDALTLSLAPTEWIERPQ